MLPSYPRRSVACLSLMKPRIGGDERARFACLDDTELATKS